MRKQLGFVMLYLYLGVAVVMVGLMLTAYLYKTRLEICEKKYENFVTEVRIKGEAAQKEADDEKDRHTKAKESADAKAKRLTAALNTSRQRLRNERARRNIVPSAPSTSSRPDLACFDRTEFRTAIQQFRKEVVGIVGKGDQIAVDLNAAKSWVADLFSQSPKPDNGKDKR